jgi:hypothetical protein
MFAVPLISSLSSVSLQQTFQSQTPAPNPALNLSRVLWNVPFEKHAELENLCHWLVCCKNLWPAAMHAHFNAEPFSLHAFDQTLRIDPHCVEKVVYGTLGTKAVDLLEDINRYVLASDDGHWRGLQIQDYLAASIDPADVPRNWPRECLEMAMRTMDMRGADLFLGNLTQLTLPNVDFSRADFRYACLDMADLRHTIFCNAKVEHATFRATRLSGANVTGLTFSTGGGNLEEMILDGAILDDIGLDIGPHAIHKGLLPPPLDALVRENLNAMAEQDFASRVPRYLPRILPHITMSPAFCKECLRLTPSEDQPVVLQAIMRQASAQYKASMPHIKSTYDAIADYVAHQFIESIDKQSHEDLQRIFGKICRNNLAYPECIGTDGRDDEDLSDDWMDLIRTCLDLTDYKKRECLQDIAQALLDEVKTTSTGFDAIRRAVKHLSLSNLTQALRTLIREMTPEQYDELIQQDLELAAVEAHIPESVAMPAPTAGAVDQDASGTANIPENNPRRLIDLIQESWPPDHPTEIHTLLRNASDGEQTILEGDWDNLSSYTADDAYADADIIATQASPDQNAASEEAETQIWKTALSASLLLFPTSYFLRS